MSMMSNVYTAGTLMATHDGSNLHFYLNDNSKTRVDASRSLGFQVDATSRERRS